MCLDWWPDFLAGEEVSCGPWRVGTTGLTLGEYVQVSRKIDGARVDVEFGGA